MSAFRAKAVSCLPFCPLRRAQGTLDAQASALVNIEKKKSEERGPGAGGLFVSRECR